MREDALQYHQRVVSEFTHALINKQDARDEAVNVLLSANNLENQGYTRILFKKNAQKYIDELQPELQIMNPSSRGMERIFPVVRQSMNLHRRGIIKQDLCFTATIGLKQ